MSETLPKFSVLFVYPESLAPSQHPQFEKPYGIQRPLHLSITPHHTSQGSTQKASMSPSFPLHLPLRPLTLAWGAQSSSGFDLTLCLRWFDPWSYSSKVSRQPAWALHPPPASSSWQEAQRGGVTIRGSHSTGSEPTSEQALLTDLLFCSPLWLLFIPETMCEMCQVLCVLCMCFTCACTHADS